MAKKISVGVNGTAHKGTKIWVGGTDGKARKGKKAWIGDASGKARLFFSGIDSYFMSFQRSKVSPYSSDGVTWSSNTLPTTPYNNGCAFGFGKYFYSDSYGDVYYSENGSEWTVAKSLGFNVKLLRYCSDGYLYAIGAFVSGDNTNWLWRTKDGVNWSNVSIKYTAAWACDIADFRYGNVNGTMGYYILLSKNANCILYFNSITASTVTVLTLGYSYTMYRGSLTMNNGKLQGVYVRNDNNASCAFSYPPAQNSTVTSSQFTSYSVQHVVSTSSGFVVILSDRSVYFVNGLTATKKTSVSNMLSSSSYTIFSGAWDGKRVVFAGGNASSKFISMYTDDLGTTWTEVVTDISGAIYDNVGCVYGIDGGGYYSE